MTSEYNDAEDYAEKTYGIDEDAAYEIYRDNACDELKEKIHAVMNSFYNNKGYYSNCADKLKRHSHAVVTFWQPKVK